MRTDGVNGLIIVCLILLAVSAVLYGCAGPADSSGKPRGPSGSGRNGAVILASPPAGAGEPVSTVIDARPAALVNGQAVTWGELRPLLNELAGGQALQEVIIDRKISAALASAGIVISGDDAAAERKTLIESLDEDANTALRLLAELRDRQNLGPARFEALMRRNAGLRALVRDRVQVTDSAVRAMHDLVHGPKRQGRIMVLPTLDSAQASINLVKSGLNFADVAVEMSIDSSAPRGGLLEPMSQHDPAYPEALRQTLWALEPAAMSGPVLIDDRYAVVMLVKQIAADAVTLDEARPALERMVRSQQERMLMDQKARELAADTAVTIFDESLQESWSRMRRTR